MLLLIKMLGFPPKEDLGEKNLLLPLVTADRQHLPDRQHRKCVQMGALLSGAEAHLREHWRGRSCLRTQLTVSSVLCKLILHCVSRARAIRISGPFHTCCLFTAPGASASRLPSEAAWRRQFRCPYSICWVRYIKLSEEVLILNPINISGMYQTWMENCWLRAEG